MSNYNIKTLQNKEDIHLCGVYKMYCKSQPEKFYIGSTAISKGRAYTRGFYKRMSTHIYLLKKNKHHSSVLQELANRFGVKSIVMEIIEVCDSERCVEREDYYIKLLTPACNSTKSAFDSTGYKHKDASLQKMSLARLGVKLSISTKNKMSLAKKGILPKNFKELQSLKSRIKRSNSLKGRKLSEKNLLAIRSPVKQYKKDGAFIQEYKSIREASIKTNTDPTSISRASSGKCKTAGGYIWASIKIKNGYSVKRLNETV